MNQKQQQYLITRIKSIYENNKINIRKDKKDDKFFYSPEETVKLIHSGKAKFRKDFVTKNNIYNSYAYKNWFEFPDLEKRQAERTKNNEKVVERLSILENSYNKIVDTIYFGDDKEALKLIEDFSKMKF
jgi:hypothetical protein